MLGKKHIREKIGETIEFYWGKKWQRHGGQRKKHGHVSFVYSSRYINHSQKKTHISFGILLAVFAAKG